MANLFKEILTQEEKDTIESWISCYAFDDINDEVTRAPLEKVLRFWNESKQGLFHMLGKNLIVEKEVTVTKSMDDLEREVHLSKETYEEEEHPSMRRFTKAVLNYADVHSMELGYGPRWGIVDLLQAYTLARNEYSGCSFTIPTREGIKDIQVQEGCKPIKILGKIADAFGIEGFEEFRLAHSQILNQKKLKGTLCLSIHPMDYMTMSDNDYDWDSCMSWRNEGCYRRGTVEMMNSNCVVVAYLKGKDDMYTTSGHYWNNKKWRQLFVVTPDCIAGIKGYPYCSEELEDMCIDWIAELATINLGWNYVENTVYFDHETWFRVGDTNFKFEFVTNTMYNDFGTRDEGHRIRVTANPKNAYESRYEICYSGTENCMYCGEPHGGKVWFDGEEPLVCNTCGEVWHCDCCGDVTARNHLYEIDDEYLCQYCYEDSVHTCPITEEPHRDNNMETIYLLPAWVEDHEHAIRYADRTYSILCDLSTVRDRYEFTKEEFAELFTIDPEDRVFGSFVRHFWKREYIVTPEMLTDKGLELFNIHNKDDLKEFHEIYDRYSRLFQIKKAQFDFLKNKCYNI